jgi:hypothetical protein
LTDKAGQTHTQLGAVVPTQYRAIVNECDPAAEACRAYGRTTYRCATAADHKI